MAERPATTRFHDDVKKAPTRPMTEKEAHDVLQARDFKNPDSMACNKVSCLGADTLCAGSLSSEFTQAAGGSFECKAFRVQLEAEFIVAGLCNVCQTYCFLCPACAQRPVFHPRDEAALLAGHLRPGCAGLKIKRVGSADDSASRTLATAGPNRRLPEIGFQSRFFFPCNGKFVLHTPPEIKRDEATEFFRVPGLLQVGVKRCLLVDNTQRILTIISPIKMAMLLVFRKRGEQRRLPTHLEVSHEEMLDVYLRLQEHRTHDEDGEGLSVDKDHILTITFSRSIRQPSEKIQLGNEDKLPIVAKLADIFHRCAKDLAIFPWLSCAEVGCHRGWEIQVHDDEWELLSGEPRWHWSPKRTASSSNASGSEDSVVLSCNDQSQTATSDSESVERSRVQAPAVQLRGGFGLVFSEELEVIRFIPDFFKTNQEARVAQNLRCRIPIADPPSLHPLQVAPDTDWTLNSFDEDLCSPRIL